MQWYEVEGYKGHQGTGKYVPVYVYIWEGDPVTAVDRYLIISGVKKQHKSTSRRFAKHRTFYPNVRPVSCEADISNLEKEIEKYMSIDKAKETFFKSKRSFLLEKSI